jgi:hypothetical protein
MAERDVPFPTRGPYRTAGVAALVAILVMVLEVGITALPGGGRTGTEALTVVGWFELFGEYPFMGLRNLGLMNMVATFFTIPVYLALYVLHRQSESEQARLAAGLAVILFLVGLAVYFANNTAFSMLSLSHSYAAAAGEGQRLSIEAAGRALLAQGESHTAGTFLGFLLLDLAGILVSVAMLRGEVFGRFAGIAGIAGYLLLLLFDVASSFVPSLFGIAMLFVGLGAPLSLVWYLLIALRLLRPL